MGIPSSGLVHASRRFLSRSRQKQVCWEPNTGPAKRSRGSSSHMPRRSIPFRLRRCEMQATPPGDRSDGLKSRPRANQNRRKVSMSVDVVPLKLHKANLELQIQINRLLRRAASGGSMLLPGERRRHRRGQGRDRRPSQSRELAKPRDTAANRSGGSYSSVSEIRKSLQVAISNQAAFTSGLRRRSKPAESCQRDCGRRGFGATDPGHLQAVGQPLACSGREDF